MSKSIKVPKRPPIEPLGSIYGGAVHPDPNYPRRYREETDRIFHRLYAVWIIAATAIGFIWGIVIEHNWPHLFAWWF